MAVLYTIKCPKCEQEFDVAKGVLMSWDFSKPIPDEFKEETPFNCPNCGHTMCVNDEGFMDNVLNTMYAD